jgi:ribonucleoside-diphosphate reductase subunit M2
MAECSMREASTQTQTQTQTQRAAHTPEADDVGKGAAGSARKALQNAKKGEAEPLLAEDESRFVMFPIQNQAIWAMYKKQVECFWRPEEVDLSKDRSDWMHALNDQERYFIKMIVAFFAGSDGLIIENLGVRFMNEVQLSEAKAFYGFQIAMENIHSEMYSLLIEEYVTDAAEKRKMFNAMSEFACIRKKADWAQKYIQSEDDFATRLVAFACIEGIFFSGAFCSIFWLKKRGLMPGLTYSNEFISRDEALHTEFAVLLHKQLKRPLSPSKVVEIVKEAVEIESEFICYSLPCALIGMNKALMTQYIEFVADRLLVQLGAPKAYHMSNPFPWMELISCEGKTNFFEKRVSEYALASKVVDESTFCMSDDF